MSTANDKAKSPQELLEQKKEIAAAEKAELRQAVMSLFIPLALFIACCIFAAGVFMVYYEEPAGWGFIAVTCVLALAAFIALFKFQNKFRAKGIIPTQDAIVESNLLDARPDGNARLADTKGETEADSKAETIAGPKKDQVGPMVHADKKVAATESVQIEKIATTAGN